MQRRQVYEQQAPWHWHTLRELRHLRPETRDCSLMQFKEERVFSPEVVYELGDINLHISSLALCFVSDN